MTTITQARVLRSEWTKLRSLPSTAWSLLVTVAFVVGFGALYATLRVTRPPRQPASIAAFDPTAVSLSGIYLAQSPASTPLARSGPASRRYPGGCRCCGERRPRSR